MIEAIEHHEHARSLQSRVKRFASLPLVCMVSGQSFAAQQATEVALAGLVLAPK